MATVALRPDLKCCPGDAHRARQLVGSLRPVRPPWPRSPPPVPARRVNAPDLHQDADPATDRPSHPNNPVITDGSLHRTAPQVCRRATRTVPGLRGSKRPLVARIVDTVGACFMERHVVLYSANADADRAFFRDVLGIPARRCRARLVDFRPAAGRTRPYIRLQPAVLTNCFSCAMTLRHSWRRCPSEGLSAPIYEGEPWGLVTHLTLPGGGTLGIYQPAHPSPLKTD